MLSASHRISASTLPACTAFSLVHVRVLHAGARLPVALAGEWLAALVGSGLVLVRGRRRAMVLYLPL